jgi:hypothetical protein
MRLRTKNNKKKERKERRERLLTTVAKEKRDKERQIRDGKSPHKRNSVPLFLFHITAVRRCVAATSLL